MSQEPVPQDQEAVDPSDPSEIADAPGEGTDHEQFRGDAVDDDDDEDDEVDANLATLEDDEEDQAGVSDETAASTEQESTATG